MHGERFPRLFNAHGRVDLGCFLNGFLLASGLIFVTVPAQAAPAQAVVRPNILLLFSDDQRADTIAALANSHIQTPNLDQLVRRGTSFSRAYCMGAMQGAVCVPSRAMLMTGRTLFRVSANLTNEATWPEAFARDGYTTFITGKWHNGETSVCRVFQEGKAIFVGGMG